MGGGFDQEKPPEGDEEEDSQNAGETLSLFNKSEFSIFRKLLEIFELFFFNESTFKVLRRNYQSDSVALESSERADVSFLR